MVGERNGLLPLQIRRAAWKDDHGDQSGDCAGGDRRARPDHRSRSAGNASTGLGIERRNRKLSSYDVMVGTHGVGETVVETAVPNLFIIPSTMDLLGVEMEFHSKATGCSGCEERFNRPKPIHFPISLSIARHLSIF